jgi:hypothetical protein
MLVIMAFVAVYNRGLQDGWSGRLWGVNPLPQMEEMVSAEEFAPAPKSTPTFEMDAWLEKTPAAIPAPEPAPPPAEEEFHLRNIRWGMLKEEVRAAEQNAPLKETPTTLTYRTTTLDLPCLLVYAFVDGRLARARILFTDPNGQDLPPLSDDQARSVYSYLLEKLRNRYGRPVEQTEHQPRDVSTLHQQSRLREVDIRQYETSIAEARERLRREKERLERHFKGWRNADAYVAKGLAPLERDLKDLQKWKKEAQAQAATFHEGIRSARWEDMMSPLTVRRTARWPHARQWHDVELSVDYRYSPPLLDIRYRTVRPLSGEDGMDEL